MEMKDENGNNLIINRLPDQINLELKLRAEKFKRKIGYIDIPTRVFVVKRERGKHLHNKSNSYGFNYKVIKDGSTFDRILLHDEDGSYIIPREIILNHGSFLFFKEKGFEKQIFLPLPIIQKYKT